MRENVNPYAKGFQEDGLVALSRGGIALLDRDGLYRFT